MGLMNQADRKRFLDYLKNYYKGCPICHSQQATLADVVSLPVVEKTIPEGIGPGPQMIVAVPVVCKTCGHVVLFNAKGFICEE